MLLPTPNIRAMETLSCAKALESILRKFKSVKLPRKRELVAMSVPRAQSISRFWIKYPRGAVRNDSKKWQIF